MGTRRRGSLFTSSVSVTAGRRDRGCKDISCHQDIASNGVFAAGMLAEFDATLRKDGAAMYPRMFWEWGWWGRCCISKRRLRTSERRASAAFSMMLVTACSALKITVGKASITSPWVGQSKILDCRPLRLTST